jgi:hypothetical protein
VEGMIYPVEVPTLQFPFGLVVVVRNVVTVIQFRVCSITVQFILLAFYFGSKFFLKKKPPS